MELREGVDYRFERSYEVGGQRVNGEYISKRVEIVSQAGTFDMELVLESDHCESPDLNLY